MAPKSSIVLFSLLCVSARHTGMSADQSLADQKAGFVIVHYLVYINTQYNMAVFLNSCISIRIQMQKSTF